MKTVYRTALMRVMILFFLIVFTTGCDLLTWALCDDESDCNCEEMDYPEIELNSPQWGDTLTHTMVISGMTYYTGGVYEITYSFYGEGTQLLWRKSEKPRKVAASFNQMVNLQELGCTRGNYRIEIWVNGGYDLDKYVSSVKREIYVKE